MIKVSTVLPKGVDPLYINSVKAIQSMPFTEEQILELCYIAYPWAVKSDDEDELFMENPVMWPFPYENWMDGSQPAPSFENVKVWVQSRLDSGKDIL